MPFAIAALRSLLVRGDHQHRRGRKPELTARGEIGFRHRYVPTWEVVINKGVWSKLSPDLQEIMKDAATATKLRHWVTWWPRTGSRCRPPYEFAASYFNKAQLGAEAESQK
jgi:hypothetical protein